MRRFLLRILFFMIPLLICWTLIEAMYRFVPNNYSAKYNGLITHKNAGVYILGNSHSFYGIDPKYMANSAYNASNISQPLIYDKLIFEKYILGNRNVKAIVLNADYFTLNEGTDDPEMLWRSNFYSRELKIHLPGKNIFDPANYSLALAVRFNLTLENIRKYIKHKTFVECSEFGSGAYHGTDTVLTSLDATKITVARHSHGNADVSANKQILEDIINKAQHKGIQVLIATMPATKLYSELADKQKLDSLKTFYKSLEKHKNVKYIDLLTDKRFTLNDFYDADHLNTDGAKKCSVIVDSTITSMLGK